MIITLRTAYKTKEYHFQPCKQANGLNLPFVKKVRYGADGESEMILSEAERNDPNRDYFIPEDADIVVTEGTTFDLDDPLEKNKWEAIKNSVLIAPSRDARDEHGNLIIDGDKYRYGQAEIWVDIPGEETEKIVKKKQLITRAWTFIENDSIDGRLTKCKLLGKNLRNAPSSDVQSYLYDEADKNPLKIIDLYTNGDTALRLLIIDAKERNIIRKQDGLFIYGETVLGATEDAIMMFFKTPTNKKVLDLIKRETYPEFVRQVEMSSNTDDKTSDNTDDNEKSAEKSKSKK
jgi:hypothetical protein